jgi:hypothetical protein
MQAMEATDLEKAYQPVQTYAIGRVRDRACRRTVVLIMACRGVVLPIVLWSQPSRQARKR